MKIILRETKKAGSEKVMATKETRQRKYFQEKEKIKIRIHDHYPKIPNHMQSLRPVVVLATAIELVVGVS